MGGACSTYVEEDRLIQGYVGEKYRLEDPGVLGRIIFRLIFFK